MFFPEGRIQVFVYGKPVDMRKSYRGLYVLTQQAMRQDPASGHLYVFINRKGNYMKIYYFDRTGYCIWSKRLEQGRYHWRESTTQPITWTELKLMLEGIEHKNTRRYKRYQHLPYENKSPV